MAQKFHKLTNGRRWGYNGAPDPDKDTQMRPYDDLDNIYIEKEYRSNARYANIGGGYKIDFKHMIQFRSANPHLQRRVQASDVNKWVRPITSDRFNEPISVTEANTGLKGANKDADKAKAQPNQDDNEKFTLGLEYNKKSEIYPTVRMMIEGIICEAIC